MARIVVAGYLVRFPLGGYVWQLIHYLLGLRALGHDVWFYEDTGHHDAAYDPLTSEYGPSYEYGLGRAQEVLSRFGGLDDDPTMAIALQVLMEWASGTH